MCFPSIFWEQTEKKTITITYHCSITANMLQIMMKCCSVLSVQDNMLRHVQTCTKNFYNKA